MGGFNEEGKHVKDKPKLTLPGKSQAAPAPAPAPEDAYGDTLRSIVREEWERVGGQKAAALAGAMARIGADDALFRYLGAIFIRQKCIKRIKRLNRAKTIAEQVTKGSPTE